MSYSISKLCRSHTRDEDVVLGIGVKSSVKASVEAVDEASMLNVNLRVMFSQVMMINRMQTAVCACLYASSCMKGVEMSQFRTCMLPLSLVSPPMSMDVSLVHLRFT